MAKTDTGIKMDDEVKKELSAIEGRLALSVEKLIHDAITKGFEGVENILTKLFNKDIGHIQEWIDTLKKYHQDHYDEAADIRKDITGMRISISEEIDKKTGPLGNRLDNLEGRQLTDEVTSKVTDKIEDKKLKKTELNIGLVSLIIAVAVAAGTLIGYLI
jgi:hypothetical protein